MQTIATAHLLIKHGEETGQILSITPPKSQFFITGGTGNTLAEFAIESNGPHFWIKPLPGGATVYLNGNELTTAQTLNDGDELAVPPEVIYVFRNSPASGQPTFPILPTTGRPGWVTFISILQFLAGAVNTLIGIQAMNNPRAAGMGALLLIMGMASFATTVGLWQMREWGRIGTVVVRGIDLLIGLTSPSAALIGDILIIVYLLRGTTAARFKR